MIRTLRVAICLVLAAPNLAQAASNICDFQAYSDDADPNGVNVRSGPGTQFPITGVLVPTHDEEGDFSPEFAVRQFQDGWVEIGDAVTGQYGDRPEELVFQGTGWVSAKLIRFEIEDPVLRGSPDLGAPVTANLGYLDGAENPWSLDQLNLTAIHACDGAFVEVTLTNSRGETARGWATDLCANQATTCV